MIKVYNNLFVGDESACFYEDREDWVVVHACKNPCHCQAVGYKGSLNSSHPNYLVSRRENHLFLNMVDMDRLLHNFTEPIVTAALDFIEKHIQSKKVLIHCNRGESRSPALALLFLAKRNGVISNENYQKAKEEFVGVYPNYRPGKGVDTYLTEYWGVLR